MLLRKIARIIGVTPIPVVSSVARVVSIGFNIFDDNRVPEIPSVPERDLLESGKTALAWFERFQGLMKESQVDESELMTLLRAVAVRHLASKIIKSNDDLSEADLTGLEEELLEAPEAAAIISQQPDLATNEAELKSKIANPTIQDLLKKLDESVSKTWDELYIEQLNRQEELLQQLHPKNS